MAKKHLGRFLTFAVIAGAAAAGISYFLQYKSFHKELDEDFHDFEDDFDEFEDTDDKNTSVTRNYVSLSPEYKAAEDMEDDFAAAEAEDGTEAEQTEPAADEEPKAEQTTDDSAPADEKKSADTTVTVEEITE